MDGNLVGDQRLLGLELVRDLNGDGAMATAAPRPLEARATAPIGQILFNYKSYD